MNDIDGFCIDNYENEEVILFNSKEINHDILKSKFEKMPKAKFTGVNKVFAIENTPMNAESNE